MLFFATFFIFTGGETKSGKNKEHLQQPKYAAAWTLIKTGLALTLVVAIFLNIDKTLGWFSNNTEVKATGMGVNVGVDSVVASIEYFKIHSVSVDNNDNNVYEFLGSPVNPNVTNALKMPSFSLLDSKRQILIKVKLKDVSEREETESIQVQVITETEKYITQYIADKTLTADNCPLSSIMEFRVTTDAGVGVDSSSGNYVISADQTEVLRFAESNSEGGFSFRTNPAITLKIEDDTEYIYIIVDYYEDSAIYAMEAINKEGITPANGFEIAFVYDFKIGIS